MSSATPLLWKTFRGIVITVPGCPINDHDQPGTSDHDHFGTLITISPESRSRSFEITDHDRPESPVISAVAPFHP